MTDSVTVFVPRGLGSIQNIPGHGVLNDTCVHAKSICVRLAEVWAADVIRVVCFGTESEDLHSFICVGVCIKPLRLNTKIFHGNIPSRNRESKNRMFPP